jgi:general secretion pathway protein K
MTRRLRIVVTRRGFALLAVLWVLTGLVLLGAAASHSASEALGAARNRVDAMRAEWVVEGCLAEARAAIDGSLAHGAQPDSVWRELAGLLSARTTMSACRLELVPAGAALDVNVADRTTLARLFVAARLSHERADALAAAIVDWRDPDDVPDAGGAEREWYAPRRRGVPRNGPFASPLELHDVRGWTEARLPEGLLGVEPGRVVLGAAPPEVVAALPGFGSEAVARLVEMRAREVPTLAKLAVVLSPEGRALLAANTPALQQLVAASPDAWIVTATAPRPSAGTTSAELRLVRAGRRAAVVRHRSSPWR